MANAPLSPRIQFVDAKGYLTRDAILLLQSLQDSTATGTFQPANTILTGLSSMGTSTGLVAQTAAASFLKRTIQASSPILVSNADGVAGDPTFGGDIASNAEVIAGLDTTKIVTPAGFAAGVAAIGTITVTPWVTYTPTFTGFGTVSNVSIWSRRLSDTLQIRGRWTMGITTATEARMTLGFNGVDGGLTSDTTKVPTTQLCGTMIRTATGALSLYGLIESGVAYITFGLQTATDGALNAKQLGNAIAATGQVWSLMVDVPITGW